MRVAMHHAKMKTPLSDALLVHVRRVPEQSALAGEYQELAAEGVHAYLRERRAGHFTGSAWLVSRDGKNVLLTHHRKLDRWLQLGGHADGDMDLRAVALKEAEEESGLNGLTVDAGIFDLDRHWIPERGDVPGHWHYDVRYVVRAGDNEAFVVSEESNALAWRDIAGIAAGSSADESLQRMAKRWLDRSKQDASA